MGSNNCIEEGLEVVEGTLLRDLLKGDDRERGLGGRGLLLALRRVCCFEGGNEKIQKKLKTGLEQKVIIIVIKFNKNLHFFLRPQ